ncbi:AAA domain-containing protein [Epithele typhae]|uniref:AAA domain-containing protein n=1 Tax=Epithele typhae TaxID=378194 RepID=UPI00200880B0|nr:AAA domain-containing protein [Epithele typhae]KAH9924969.1 AAA domain-containing protein [Epithele typhae]
MSSRRLKHVLAGLRPPPQPIGVLKLGDISHEILAARDPSRLPHSEDILLDIANPFNLDNLHFMLQKFLLGQDIFLLSQPGPYARRLALTFCRMINSEYELVALHRDVGETELKQGREIREGGNLVYVDSAAVRAVKYGRVLVIEGVEKAERGIMPVLNNLLENREMNLEDGTHIVHPHRYELLDTNEFDSAEFIPAHKNFRVIAIAAPVPPYPGYPLDPPFRSRFQARFVDPLGALLALQRTEATTAKSVLEMPFYQKLRDIITSTQIASESRHVLDAVARSTLPAFPQTALAKATALLSLFPPPPTTPPEQLARFVLCMHPALIHSPFIAWAMLSRQFEEAGLGELGSPNLTGIEDDVGLFGYRLARIDRVDDRTAHVTFASSFDTQVDVDVPAGPLEYLAYPFANPEFLGFVPSARFMGLLTALLQAHALGWDLSYTPPALASTASCSTSTLVRALAAVLGYELEDVHVYKELGGRELVMRRKILDGGATTWEPSPLVEGAWEGRLVHLAGLDVIGSTAGALARLTQDREVELWETKRIVRQLGDDETTSADLSVTHPSFRIISTASKSLPLKDWLSDEHANMFFTLPAQPMSPDEESALLLQAGCPDDVCAALLRFADRYRAGMTADAAQKNRKLGMRALLCIARRAAQFPADAANLHVLLGRTVLQDFLPPAEQMNLNNILEECGITKRTPPYNPPPEVRDSGVVFPAPSGPQAVEVGARETFVPFFDRSQDPDGAVHVPHMVHFYDNSLQTGLMRDLAVDLEVLGEHLVLLGNQGVGKNKVIDRLCQLLGRPREYIQLHRDTTVNQLMFQTVLENGLIKYTDSPLLRAIQMGRVIVIDEADKAAEHVVAIFRSLAGHGQLTLADGRRVRQIKEREGDIAVHPNFRLILLANRPGYPFLGNHFLQVLGDNFCCHAVTNPDMASERRLLSQLAPQLSEDTILRLVAAFQDLRRAYDAGTLTYPYSLRELLNLVRHMQAYPSDSLEAALRNVFDFDVYKPETISKLQDILDHHGLAVKHVGMSAARETAKKQVLDLKFEPQGDTSLSSPKFGKEDPDNEPHTGGNTWAGGTGGRDTAGLGGRGGYMRLFKGHDINQISDALKNDVPDHVKDRAREMARQELARRLEELNLSAGEAKGYGSLLNAVDGHITQLHDLLENLAAREEERVWVKRQTDGELDDSRLTEGLTGEATVYKRRGMAKPELGRPQMKPKRIRFLFDVSASMYRFQADGRLRRSMETAVMLMETFDRLNRKEKFVWDIYGHSGDSAEVALVEAGENLEINDRWKVVEKMEMITQYTFAGDFTVEAIDKAVTEVAKFDGDDWFVIALTDANFARYNITAEEIQGAMNRNPKVHTALVCIGEGAEAAWIPRNLPGRGYRVSNTADIPTVLRSILSTMVDK